LIASCALRLGLYPYAQSSKSASPPAPAPVWRRSAPPGPGWWECPAGALPLPVSGSSPAARLVADTSSKRGPLSEPRATPPRPPLRCRRTSVRPRPPRPRFHEPVRRRGREYPPDGSCRTGCRSGTRAPPSPLHTASLRRVLIFSGVSRFMPIAVLPLLRKRIQSKGPSLPRRYPASTVLRPSPTSDRTDPLKNRSRRASTDRVSPVARFSLPTCRSHYPGGSDRFSVDAYPARAAFPDCLAGRHPQLRLSRPARALLTLRPAGSLNRPRRPLSRGFNPEDCSPKPLVSYRTHRHLSGWNLPPLEKRTLQDAQAIHRGAHVGWWFSTGASRRGLLRFSRNDGRRTSCGAGPRPLR
jgi:hypothetical protein